MILNLSFIISSKRISETKKKNKFTFLIPIILKFYKIRQCRNTYIVSHLKIRIEISRVINRASKQNTASLFATRRNLSFSYRTKRKLNYPVPIVSTKIGPPAERKERRRKGRRNISLDAKIFALYRDHRDEGWENFKKEGGKNTSVHPPAIESVEYFKSVRLLGCERC